MFKKRTKQATVIDTANIPDNNQADLNKQPIQTVAPIQQQSKKEQKDSQAAVQPMPVKKVKLDKTNQGKQLGGSTNQRTQAINNTLHQQFQSLHYYNPSSKKQSGTQKQQQQKLEQGDSSRILVGQQAEQTESQLAKQRYLQQVETTKLIKDGKLSGKIYRGANNYANYQLTESELANPKENYTWKHGPARASSNSGAQNTCRFDYDPSLCKDWHDSGYCVFGNSCLYLHDRSDYKSGWQLQKDYQQSQRQRWQRINNPDIVEQEDYIKDLQRFKPCQTCSYCKQAYKLPVETTCRHVFCMRCLQKMNRKQKKCATCSKKLDGIMNNAEKALKKQKQEYQQLLKVAEKNQEISLGKRSKYRNINSLQVFNKQ